MSDAGLILEVKRDGLALSENELRLVLQELRSSEPSLLNTLGEEAIWKPIPTIGLALFEYWGEAGDSLVLTPDGSIAQAPWRTQVVEDEEVAMPDIPEGNPPAEELWRRLLDLDLNLASIWVARRRPSFPELSMAVRIVHW